MTLAVTLEEIRHAELENPGSKNGGRMKAAPERWVHAVTVLAFSALKRLARAVTLCPRARAITRDFQFGRPDWAPYHARGADCADFFVVLRSPPLKTAVATRSNVKLAGTGSVLWHF